MHQNPEVQVAMLYMSSMLVESWQKTDMEKFEPLALQAPDESWMIERPGART